jgi:hypothetical protein
MSAKTRRLLKEIDERLEKALELIQQSASAVDLEAKKELRCEACLLMEQNVEPLDRLHGPEAERRKGAHHGPFLAAFAVAMALGLELAKGFAVEAVFSSLRTWAIGRALAMALLAVVAVG